MHQTIATSLHVAMVNACAAATHIPSDCQLLPSYNTKTALAKGLPAARKGEAERPLSSAFVLPGLVLVQPA